MVTPLIILKGIGKEYVHSDGSTVEAIQDITFTLYEGDFVTLVGPNGAGKTSLLNIISGIEQPTRGSLEYGKKDLRMGYVFQNYDESLLPWRTVQQNIQLPFEGGYVGHQEDEEKKIQEIIQLLRLEQYADKYPYMLSGGKKQLTALARALVIDPDVLIMDEPFSSLDFDTTRDMEELVMRIWEKLHITVLCVSHNIDEAVLLANKVLVLTQRPSVVSGVVDVGIPRPRSYRDIVSQEFVKIKKMVMERYE